jgi:hypothetical protein
MTKDVRLSGWELRGGDVVGTNVGPAFESKTRCNWSNYVKQQ